MFFDFANLIASSCSWILSQCCAWKDWDDIQHSWAWEAQDYHWKQAWAKVTSPQAFMCGYRTEHSWNTRPSGTVLPRTSFRASFLYYLQGFNVRLIHFFSRLIWPLYSPVVGLRVPQPFVKMTIGLVSKASLLWQRLWWTPFKLPWPWRTLSRTRTTRGSACEFLLYSYFNSMSSIATFSWSCGRICSWDSCGSKTHLFFTHTDILYAGSVYSCLQQHSAWTWCENHCNQGCMAVFKTWSLLHWWWWSTHHIELL